MVTAAIDKYVYVTVNRPFNPGIYLKYSQLSPVANIRRGAASGDPRGNPHVGVQNAQGGDHRRWPIFRRAQAWGRRAALPRRCYTPYSHRRRLIHPGGLAGLACEIEIERLREPVGKQDQYIAAYGGVTCFEFCPDDTVSARPLGITTDTLHDLEDNLLLFFTGFARSAGSILQDQQPRSQQADPGIDPEPPPCQRNGPPQPGTAGARPGASLWRVDARALGAQEAAFRRHEQPMHRRMV